MKREGLDDQGSYFSINQVSGTAPILFCHGVGLSSKIWYPQINFFENKQTTIVYDLLNHGHTTSYSKDLNFDDFSSQIDGLLQYLQYPKVNIVGFSLGALITAHYASIHSNKVNKIVLFGSIHKRSKSQQESAQQRYEEVTDNYFDIPNQLQRWFNEDYLNKNKKDADLISEILSSNNHQDFLRAYKLFAYFKDDMISYDQILNKTLIITGENDIGSTKEMSLELGKTIKNAEVKIISNGKHLSGIECSSDVNAIIGDFLSEF